MTNASQFEPGQVWTYATRPGDEDSRIIILQVDTIDDEPAIVHVQVTDVAVEVPGRAEPTVTISHMPFAAVAVAESVLACEMTGEVPDFAEGYRQWREAFDGGNAGVFSTGIGDAVAAMAGAIGG